LIGLWRLALCTKGSKLQSPRIFAASPIFSIHPNSSVLAMSAERPVIVLVHGAFHPPHCYRPIILALREEGYIVLAPPLPTTGLDDSVAGKTYVDDVKRIHEFLIPRLDQGEEAVLVCHSQGGISGSAATEGQTIHERKAQGLKGGIKAVVYIAAFTLTERGSCLFEAVGGIPPDFYDADVSSAKTLAV
jgi:pimeloyl-ACP methyl ester carboxylesterase